MILIDFSAISIAPVAMGITNADENLIRHMILNSIRMYRQKFKDKYGEIVIVADGGGNWRKDVYPEYKGKRKESRDKSKIDWDEAFRCINLILQEIKENFPYKVIHQWGCEADDSIAEIVKHTQEFGNHENVIIVSADKDFRQLQKYNNVRQWSTATKKFIDEPNPRLYLQEHIIKGDTGDGVPNVLSDDKCFIDGRRQGVMSAKKKAALLEDPKSLGTEVYRNYLRNKKMIDLTENSECPKNIKEEIINSYIEQNQWGNKSKVFPYLVSKRCRILVESVQEFI